MSRINTRRLPRLLAACAATALALTSLPALSATETDNLEVSASVTANCTIVAAALAFGAYDPVVAHKNAPLTGQANITVACTDGADATIRLGQGANADAGSSDAAPLRRMVSGGNHLSYSLFSDAPRTAVWGATAETDVDYVGTGVEANLVVYGSIAADQNVPEGAYADTVVATIEF